MFVLPLIGRKCDARFLSQPRSTAMLKPEKKIRTFAILQ